MVDGRPAVEILYYIANEVHRLKVGLHFQDKLIHDVVNMLHGKEIISATWLNFTNIGKICSVSKNCVSKIMSHSCDCCAGSILRSI